MKLKKKSEVPEVEEEVEEESEVEPIDFAALEQEKLRWKQMYQVEESKKSLKLDEEFRYYLLNNLMNINETLKKIGLTLNKIGQKIE